MESYTNPAGESQETPVPHETESAYAPYESQPYRYSYSNFGVPPQPRYEPAPKPPKKKRRMLWIMIQALCFSIFGSAIGAGGVLLVQHYMDQKQEEVIPPQLEENISYDSDTGDGVVVLTTGANEASEHYGLSYVFDKINSYIYELLSESF